ncbi:MAG: FIST C-terminal domain-containing protein [Phycisphaerales bacterium]|nr:FIST C-terminal domain-containing protein [Planctomycetota bacterium]MCH8509779.1 FIST C-terminal domain-containing protein [Phycisphaerales bacterium]
MTDRSPDPAGPRTGLRCRSGLSVRADTYDAASDLGERLAGQFEADAKPDLVMFFATPEHTGRMGTVQDALRAKTGARSVVGVTGAGVMAGATERERATGIAAIAMHLPGVRVRPFWIEPPPSGDAPADRAASLSEQIGAGDDLRATFFFADPFSVPLVNLVPDLSAARTHRVGPDGASEPIGVVLGGMASAGGQPGSNTLVCDGEVRSSGAMGVSLSGRVRVDTVVSQGCRPFGPRMVITKARGNLILELGGEPAVEAIRKAVQSLSDADKQLLGGSLLVGRVIDDTKKHLGRGDYLVRVVLGADEQSGAVAIADLVRAGQTVRLHLHDARTAREDLALLLDGQRLHARPSGALVFSCNSRGERFFGDGGHDAATICHAFDPAPDGPRAAKTGREVDPGSGIPLAGFFAAGEIGPIGDQIFHHGHTAVVALIRGPERDDQP